MSKPSSDEVKAPAHVPRGVTAGTPVPPADWETRLREARALREEALSLRRANAEEEISAPVIGPWPTPRDDAEQDTAQQEDNDTDDMPSQSPPGLLQRTISAAPQAMLTFSAAAGLAFGTVIGLGVLFVFGTGERPRVETAVAPDPTPDPTAVGTEVASLVRPPSEEAAPPAIPIPAPASNADDMAGASYWTPALYPVEAHPMIANPPVTPRPAPQTVAMPAVLRPPAVPLRDDVAEPSPRPDTAPTVAVAPDVLDALDEAALLIPATVPAVRTPGLLPSSGQAWSGGAAAPQALAQPQATDAVFISQAGPATLGAEFFLHAPDGLTQSKLNAQVAELEGSGVILAGIGREGFRVSQTHLRYYSPETAALAQAVAEKLGVEARDFTQGSGNAKRIEVWVSGRPKAAPEPPKPTGFFARLRDSFRNDP